MRGILIFTLLALITLTVIPDPAATPAGFSLAPQNLKLIDLAPPPYLAPLLVFLTLAMASLPRGRS